MNDLIDGRVMLLRMHEELCYDIACRDCSMCNEDGGCRVEEWIDKFQSADAVSVVHGEWKPFDLTWGRSIWYCTACEDSVEVPCDIWTHKPIYNFCPNCGARMYGEAKESEQI